MKKLRLHSKRVKIEDVRNAAGKDDIKMITRAGDYYLNSTFNKILSLLNFDFKVYSTRSDSYIEVKDGKIYFRILNINGLDTTSWLMYADKHRVAVENFNVEYFADPEDDVNMIRKVVPTPNTWIY